jgi:hypothetical protein
MPDWQWCTAQLNHQPCASGLGNATSSKTDNQPSPALDGSSSKFTIAGPKGYSNALWWKSVSGGLDAAHFSYDVSFYIDHPEVSEALEFDVNQSFNGTRYVWGSECNFKDTGKWDIWDPKGFVWYPQTFRVRYFQRIHGTTSPGFWSESIRRSITSASRLTKKPCRLISIKTSSPISAALISMSHSSWTEKLSNILITCGLMKSH